MTSGSRFLKKSFMKVKKKDLDDIKRLKIIDN